MAQRILIVSVLILSMVISPVYIVAENDESSKWRELNRTSDKVLQYVREGHYEDAHNLLPVFSEQFLSLQSETSSLSMHELNVITSVFEEVEGATVQVSLPHEERVKAATKLRLLIDVYESSHSPLWLKTKNQTFQALSNVQSIARDQTGGNLEQRINGFISQYEVVRPAWSVSLNTENYQMIESQIQYLRHLRENGTRGEELVNHLDRVERQLEHIYDAKEDEVSDPQLIWVMVTIGGVIIAVLSYAGWKKYQGEKQRELDKIKRRKRKPYR